ncbi:MAG: hypothetical protein FJZ16_07595 [Candidatus Omnitrophica bacterium]|nr:hypothetical protein [Candidatus Omnitrophota bacterium]
MLDNLNFKSKFQPKTIYLSLQRLLHTTPSQAWLWRRTLRENHSHLSPSLQAGLSVVRGKSAGLYLFLVLLILFFLLLNIYNFNRSSCFNIEFVEVRLKRIDTTQAPLFYKFKGGVNIFQKNLFSKLNFFAHKFDPDIKNVIIKRLLPCKIIVYIVERIPCFFVRTKTGLYIIDRDFVVLSSTPQDFYKLKRENIVLPTVLGLEAELNNTKVGHRFNSFRLKIAKEILRAFNSSLLSRYFSLATINVSQTRRISVGLSDGTELILNEELLKNRLDNLLRIFSELKKNNIKPRYIDLRFEEPVIGIR